MSKKEVVVYKNSKFIVKRNVDLPTPRYFIYSKETGRIVDERKTQVESVRAIKMLMDKM